MNKRGFLISLASLIVLLVIAVFFIMNSRIETRNSNVQATFVEHKIAADYVEDIGKFYLQPQIETSMKYSLKAISKEIKLGTIPKITDLKEVEGTIMTGKFGAVQIISQNYTLPYLRNYSLKYINNEVEFHKFNLTVNSIYQTNSWQICMDSTIDFEISAGNLIWDDVRIYQSCIDVDGLVHSKGPLGSADKTIQKKFWRVDSNANYCFLKSIYPTYGCDGGSISGICPNIPNGCCDLFGSDC